MKKEIVNEWFELGNRDVESAKVLLKSNIHFSVVLFHLQQAVEKYIKGFLIHNGWKLKKIHDLETLLNIAMEFDDKFKEYLDFGRKLTVFFYEERYPPGLIPSYEKKELNKLLRITEKLIKKIKNKTK